MHMKKDDQNYPGLIDKEQYQVFVFVCPGNLPFNFALHPWFVVNNRGSISRWEVLIQKTMSDTSWGHLHRNFFPPFNGIEIISFSRKYTWKGKLLGKIEGDVAKRIAEYIERSPTTYPYRNKYFLSGPNSSTYVQWVLCNFPELNLVLPWKSFGKSYNTHN